MKKLYTLLLMLTVALQVFSQVAVNTTGNSADTSAMLDVQSTSKGILIPRLTTSQRTGIYSPATGLMVYDTDDNAFYYYNGTSWTKIESSVAFWNLSSNNLHVSDTSYNVGIGTSNPSGKFEVSTVKHNGTYGSDQCNKGTAEASSVYGSYKAKNAFDDNNGTYWLCDNTLPVDLEYDLGSGNDKRIAKYRIFFYDPLSNFNRSPKDWIFQASNDQTNWIQLDEQTNQGWGANRWKEFTFDNTTQYRYYRLHITDNNGSADNYFTHSETQCC